MATTPNAPSTSLNAIPGETYAQYEARLGFPQSTTGASAPAGVAPAKPPAPAVYSSTPAKNEATANLATLSNAQNNYSSNSVASPNTPGLGAGKFANQSNPPTPPAQSSNAISNPITATSNNQALQSIIDKTNQIIKSSGVQLSPENQAALNKINGLDASVASATANAQTAASNNNYSALNDYIKQMKDAQTKRDTELQNLYDNLAEARKTYTASLAPSALSTDLQTQLNNVKSKIAAFDISTKEGQQAEFGLGRPLALSTGRAEKLGQQAALTRDSFVNEENSLAAQLGLSQQADQARTAAAKQGMDFAMQDITFANQMADRAQQQEQDAFTRFQALNTMQRQQAADMLDSLKGVDPGTLSSDVRVQLAQISEQRGIPSDALFAGLKAQYDSFKLGELQKQATLANTKATTEKSLATPAKTTSGLGASSKGNSTKEYKSLQDALSKDFYSRAGKDGYVSPEDWKAAMQYWVTNTGGTAANFKTKFSNLINPADPQDYGYPVKKSNTGGGGAFG